ncbi:primosomal protein N' [Eubacterium limosum]|uniref:replication restart helicase PriA n=1 Tax=Eubacterium limosum TaxID=1736 RepID=UPI00371F7CA5
MKFAEIYLNQTNKRIDHPYDYKIPERFESVIVPGVRVGVTFGNGNRQLEGFVVRVKEETAYPDKIKELEAVIDESPILTKEQIALCLWMKSTYCSLFYEGLYHFTSPVKVVKRLVISEEDPHENRIAFEPYESTEKIYRLERKETVRGSVQKQILELLETRDFTRREICELLGEVGSSLRALEKKGLVSAYERDTSCAVTGGKVRPEEIVLSESGNCLYRQLSEKRRKGTPSFIFEENSETRLMLYCKAVEECLSRGETALMLFPEIGLSLEMRALLYRYFGNAVAVCHGKLSQKERYQIFKRVSCGEIKVLVGSRAALFMPFRKLGLIIVDEERDPSYYSAAMPRYNTITIAQKYADLSDADLIISDEIPSVAAVKKTETGEWTGIHNAPCFVRKKPVPAIVDMQSEMKSGNFDFMSYRLRECLEKTLAEKKTALLLINKRGYASYVFCRSCGYVEKCPTCGVALKYHAGGDVLKCHYCGYTKKRSTTCPECGEKKIKALGLGIDQVYELLKERYPDRHVLKLDGETIASYDDFKRVNHELSEKHWDIILGTRMLLRNFDFQNIGLAAALLIDGDLNHGDYSSSENAYQLYKRFFNRMTENTLCLIQTYEPDNITNEALISENPTDFYKQEFEYRRLMGYPPEKHLVLFSLFHVDEAQVANDSHAFFHALKKVCETGAAVEIYEPFLSGIIRGNGQIRWKILLKTKDLNAFKHIIEEVTAAGEIERLASKVSIEIDPPATL